MSNKLGPFFYDNAQEPAVWLKVINYVAATLGVGTFLGFVNLFVGVLSGIWLATQLYTHYKYEVPYKRARLQRELENPKACDEHPRQNH